MGDSNLPWIEANPRIKAYEKQQKYVLTVYWIFTLVTTVGYGDFTGSTKREYAITVLFQFAGILIFSMISFLIVKVLQDNFDFPVFVSEKFSQYESWLSQLEKANERKSIQPHLLKTIRKRLEDAFIFDFNMIIEEV